MASITTTYAIKSLSRHLRRTVLSVLGVAIGCASSLITISFVRGEGEMFMRSVAETGTGHVRIAPHDWLRLRDNGLRIASWAEELERARALPHVVVATPRSRVTGLLGAGTQSVGVEIVGVDPETELASNRLLRAEVEGRLLQPGDEGRTVLPLVLGKAAAERLDVELGDDVMVTTSDASGQMRQAMLSIVGLVSTGSDDIDLGICQVPLADFERLSGLRGAGEIVIIVDKPMDTLDSVVSELRAATADDNEVLTWDQVSPEIIDAVAIDESFTWLTVIVVVFLVFLGIMSAQLTAVLERRREFAVLYALGMKASLLVRVMLIEGVLVGLAGAILGILLTLPPVFAMAEYGITLMAEDMVTAGFMIDPILYGDMGVWIVPYGLALSLTATILASIYPAWFAVRIDPAAALRAS